MPAANLPDMAAEQLQQTAAAAPADHDPWTGPPKDGLYDPQLEKEACGVGFIVAIDGKRTNKVTNRPPYAPFKTVLSYFFFFSEHRVFDTISNGTVF